MRSYPLADELLAPLRRVAMPRPPRLVAPGSTIHVVSRCNNREFYFKTADDFAVLLSHLDEMRRTYEVTLYGYTLMSNHVHLILQAPTAHELGQPLGWFLTQTAKAFHKARGRRGHFWERRYRGCLIEDDPYALGALRYLDWNAVRAGLVVEPAAYPWSSCAAYALGTPNPLITFHPTYSAAPDSVHQSLRCLVRGEGPLACMKRLQAFGPPRGPYREGRAAAPPRTLPPDCAAPSPVCISCVRTVPRPESVRGGAPTAVPEAA